MFYPKGKHDAIAELSVTIRVLCSNVFAASSQQNTEAMADKDNTKVFDDIQQFDASKLKKTETKESNTLPTKESE